jgi:SAM-dependent methyltransferase
MGTPASALALAAREGFSSSAADGYERGRPEYSRGAVRRALELFGLLPRMMSDDDPPLILLPPAPPDTPPGAVYPPRPVVEVGSGTGKFTRVVHSLLEEECARIAAVSSSSPSSSPVPPRPNLVCVEPAGMGERLAAEFPHLTHVRSTALDLPSHLPAGSAGAIVIANSFHWMADEASVAALARVLCAGGVLGIVWFHWDMDMDETDEEERTGGGSAAASAAAAAAAAAASASASASASAVAASSPPSSPTPLLAPIAPCRGDIRLVITRVIHPFFSASTPPYPSGTGSWRHPLLSSPDLVFSDAQRVKLPLPPDRSTFTEAQLIAWVLSFSALARQSDAVREEVARALGRELRDEEGRHNLPVVYRGVGARTTAAGRGCTWSQWQRTSGGP